MPPAQSITSLHTVLAGLASGSSSGKVIGTKRSGPVGIESIIEYRSESPVYLNVVDWVDTFLVTNIAGLDSADLRSSALPNPGEHGETPNDGLWGGRTIILTGKLFAHTIWKLRDMQQGLRGAFLDLKEYPLIFHAADPANDLMIKCRLADKINIPDQQTTRNEYQRDFQIPLRASNPRFLSAVREQMSVMLLEFYTNFDVNNTVVIEDRASGWTLPPDPPDPKYTVSYTTSRVFFKCQETVKITLPATSTGTDEVHLVLAYVDSGNYLSVSLEAPNKLAINRFELGVKTVLATVNLTTMVAGSPYYVRARMSDGVIFAEAAKYDLDAPIAGNPLPTSLSYAMSTHEIANYQNTLLPMRLGIRSAGSNWVVEEWRYYTMDEPKNWTALRGMGTVTVQDQVLQPLTNSNKLLIRTELPYEVADATVTVKHSFGKKPSSTVGDYIGGVAAKVLDKDNFITAVMTGKATGSPPGAAISIIKYDNAVDTVLEFDTSGPMIQGTDYWIRLITNGNLITAQRWLSDPAEGGTPDFVLTHTLTGADAAKFGTGIEGQAGIFWQNATPLGCSMDDFKLDFAAFNDVAYKIYNNGNFEAQTTIELTGPMTNPRVTNEANDTSFLINGTIPASETWVLENDGPSKRMYRASDGANRFFYLDQTSMWILLDPGGVANNIRLTATGLSTGWDMQVSYRHTYM